MAKHIDKAVEKVLSLVDEEGGPENMSKADYSEFLAELISSLEIRKEAVDQELEDGG
jgi:hypothetical protein